MKFIVAVVILAVAVSSQASLLPYGAHLIASPLSYTAHSIAAPLHVSHYAAPIVTAPVIAHEASYVAANRGSVHVAPLPGHIESAASVNLQPAPGTW